MMMSSIGEERGVVCVTGASGFIASWVVKLLLESGYTARATVGDVNDPKKTQHLLALDGAKERLHLFRAELTEAGSFDSALNGCEGIFHTASPVICSITMFPTRRKFIKLIEITKLLDSAVKGTLNVLRSCTKVSSSSSSSIKRVVLTCSIAAVVFSAIYNIYEEQQDDFDEFCINFGSNCKAEDDSSKEKARELGVEFTPLEVSVRDTVESLKEKGCFKP